MLKPEAIEAALEAGPLSSKFYYFPEIDSTNVYAKSLADENDAFIITDYQTNGRGRLQRTWESEKSKNLTFTIKKKFDIDTENIQAVNFYFSYFLLAYLKDFIAKNITDKTSFPQLSLKWPNDILLNYKKICGLLIENNISKKEFIIGIGINVNQEKFSGDYANKTTSLKNFLGKEISLDEFLSGLIDTYGKNLHLLKEKNYELIFKLWKNSTDLIGKDVTYTADSQNIKSGKIIDLMKDGAIKIEQKDEILTFYSGEIKLAAENAPR